MSTIIRIFKQIFYLSITPSEKICTEIIIKINLKGK